MKPNIFSYKKAIYIYIYGCSCITFLLWKTEKSLSRHAYDSAIIDGFRSNISRNLLKIINEYDKMGGKNKFIYLKELHL
jgi:predicted secreted protein